MRKLLAGAETLHVELSLQIDLAEECRVMPEVHA